MKMNPIKYLKKEINCEKGSFTIEASLLFPIIFLLILSIVLISIIIYHMGSLYYIASSIAERTTYNWDNSFKNQQTGEIKFGEYEKSLYWRLTDDRIIDSLLMFSNNYQPIEVKINETNNIDSLSEKKLMLSSDNVPKGIKGKLIYQNIIQRKVIVELESSIKIPSFISNMIGSKVKVTAYSTVTEPDEFIRTVDLIRGYSSILNEQKDKVADILKKQKVKEQ